MASEADVQHVWVHQPLKPLQRADRIGSRIQRLEVLQVGQTCNRMDVVVLETVIAQVAQGRERRGGVDLHCTESVGGSRGCGTDPRTCT